MRRANLTLEDETMAALDDAADSLRLTRSAMANLVLHAVLVDGATGAGLADLMRAALAAGKARSEERKAAAGTVMA